MGTRGLVGWKLDEQYYGTYNHWDSYPEHLGREVVEWIAINLNSDENIGHFKCNLRKVAFVKESDNAPLDLQEKYKHFSNTQVGDQSLGSWYCLLRNLQGVGYIDHIMKGELEHAPNNINFIKDSLFCEYAYVLNMDSNELEFYVGFQKKPQENNPFGTDAKEGYYPCALEGVIPFKNIIFIASAFGVRKD